MQRENIKALFIEETRLRLTSNQVNYTQFSQPKFGQTLKCFSLDKKSSEHLSSPKKTSKPKSYHLIKTPTKTYTQNLAKLLEFYQSQKSKKSNSSDKNLTRINTSQTYYKTQRNSTFVGKLSEQRSTPVLPIKSLNEASTSSFLKEPFFVSSPKQFTNIFPSELYVHRPVREKGSDRKSYAQSQEQVNSLELMMRKAFIPASKLKNSPRRLFFEKQK